MFLKSGSILSIAFSCCFELISLIQPTWFIAASVCRCFLVVMEGVIMKEWWLTVLFTLVYRCLQPSHIWLSSIEQLVFVWVASVYNNRLTSPAALRSPAGFGAQVIHNVGGSSFSSASLELSSTELFPEERQRNYGTTSAARIPMDANFVDVDILPAV